MKVGDVGQMLPIDQPGALRARFAGVHDLVAAEVVDLTAAQLDWQSDRWAWSRWSIRRQLGHIASCSYGWLCVKWGPVLYPGGLPGEHVALASMTPEERVEQIVRLDAAGLLERLDRAMGLALEALDRETPRSLKEKRITVQIDAPWDFMARAHAEGVVKDADDPFRWRFTLEATLRHVYFEAITHLYNIQRLKRAQGMTTRVEVPFEGYWAQDDWDRSEP